jgi:hypothetical protein
MALVRIPVLLALLVASGPLQWRYAQTRFVFTQDGAISSVPPWLALIALAVVFIVVAGAGVEQRHADGAARRRARRRVPDRDRAAADLGAGRCRAWTEAMGGTTGASYAQMLAVVWAMLVVRTMRSRVEPADRPPGGPPGQVRLPGGNACAATRRSGDGRASTRRHG